MFPEVPSPPFRRHAALGGLLLAALLVSSLWRFPQGSDGTAMLATAESLLYRGTLAVDHSFLADDGISPSARLGADGRVYSKYGIGFPLLEIPVLAAADLAAGATGADPAAARVVLLSLLNPALAALCCLLVASIAQGLGASSAQANVLGGSCGLATLLGAHATSDGADVLLATLLTAAIAALATYSRTLRFRAALGCGVALGYAVLTKSAFVIVVPAFAAGMLAIPRQARRQSRGPTSRRELVAGWTAFLAPVAAAVVATLALNTLRFGSPTANGYNAPIMTADMAQGMFALTLGLNKGLLWYAPPAVLGVVGCLRVRDGDTPVAAVTLLASASLALATSRFYDWGGGWTWGPRYLLPAVPALVAGCAPLLGSRIGRASVSVAVAVGALVSLLGVVISEEAYRRTTRWAWLPEVSGTVKAGVTGVPGTVLDVTIPAEDVVPTFSSIAGHWWLLRVALDRCDCSRTVWWCACANGDLQVNPRFDAAPWRRSFPEVLPAPPHGESLVRPAALRALYRRAWFDPARHPPQEAEH